MGKIMGGTLTTPMRVSEEVKTKQLVLKDITSAGNISKSTATMLYTGVAVRLNNAGEFYIDGKKALIEDDIEGLASETYVDTQILDKERLFVADIQTTTVEEITAAVKAKKVVIARYHNKIYPLMGGNSTEWVFGYVDEAGELVTKVCNAEGWFDNSTITFATQDYVDEQLGDIETALDGIIAIQNQLMGVSE